MSSRPFVAWRQVLRGILAIVIRAVDKNRTFVELSI